jgi:hypothetical protein
MPSIAAISVVTRAPDSDPPAAPQAFEALDGYGNIMLRWDASPEDDLAGYVAEYSATGGEPWNPLSAPGGDIERVRWRIDPASVGETWFYRVRAVDVFDNQSAPSEAASATVLAHDASALPTVDVIIEPAHLETLNDSPASDDYVPCDIEFDGSELFTDAICRYRGNVARSLRKKSWKVKVLLGQYQGRETFNFNAEYIDKSLMRERVSYEILGRNNVPAPQARYVHLSVNDEWRGVYLDIENVNREFLRRVGLEDNNATMYKAAVDANLTVLPTPADYMERYEKELGDPTNYDDLIQFITELNTWSPDLFFHWVATRTDLNRLYDFYSTEVVLQNHDIAFKNWFLHHDLNTDKWTFIPWDVDLTFGDIWPFSSEFKTNGQLYLATQNALFLRLAQHDITRALHHDRVRQIIATTFDPLAVAALVDSAHSEIAYDADRDWWKWGWESSELFEAAPARFAQFVDERTAYLLAAIAQNEITQDLVLNEFMASNHTAVADEWGDYDDWVEILNRSAAPVTLSGLYLTDDLGVPNKMLLPDTTLAAGEMLIVWCDAEPWQGSWHAPFSLGVDGEEIGLFSGPLTTDPPLDVIVFDEQWTDASYGRLPDGSPYWQILPTSTAGAPNVGGGNIVPQIRDVFHFPPSPATGQPVVVTGRIFDDGAISNAELLYDAGTGFTPVAMADDGMSGDGEAGDGIWGGEIPGQSSAVEVRYYLSATDDLAAISLEPPAAPDSTYSFMAGFEAPPLFLNEFMASNDTTIADEWGEFDDWVEIYNDGPGSIDLGGMFLTDDFTQPTRFELPDTTLLEGQYLIIWCDNDPEQGSWHTGFKLDAEGEEIGLFDTVAMGVGLIDSVLYGQQLTDVSMGRIPDGGNWQVMPEPTPGATNNQTGVEEVGAPPLALALRGPFPNPFNPSTRFELVLPETGAVTVRVYDVGGRRVRSLIDHRLTGGRHMLRWDGRDGRGRPVSSGVYWVKLESPAGTRTVRAVLIR